MVKARDLINAIKNGNYKAEVVDEGDLRPYFRDIHIDTDEKNRCHLKGILAYKEDDVKCAVDPGRSEVVIMGITFSNDVLNGYNVDIDGDIEYDENPEDEDADECEELYDVAQECIDWPYYDVDNYPFDESSVDADDIYRMLKANDYEPHIFALNKNNQVCDLVEEDLGLDFMDTAPDKLDPSQKEQLVSKLASMGYTYLTMEEAYRRLSTDTDIDYDVY